MISYETPEKQIVNLLDFGRLEQIKQNRKKLKTIIENICFLGRQNISLQSHREQGDITERLTATNEGNLRELIRHQLRTGHETLKSHFESAGLRTKYISNTIQNDLINCIGIISIVDNVRKCKYYSLIFDETTDISHVFRCN